MKIVNKIKSWLGLGKSNHQDQNHSDVLLEIAYRLETSHYDPNTTRFERYDIARHLTEQYYKSKWDIKSHDNFDEHITSYLNEVYPPSYIKPIPILVNHLQCHYAILIAESIMESYFVGLGWSQDDIMTLSTQLAVNFEYDESLDGEMSLYDQIDMYLESTKALQIAEEYSASRRLFLTGN